VKNAGDHEMNRILMVFWVALMVAACGGDADIQAWMQEKTSEMRPKVEVVPPVKPHEVVAYEVAGMLDPFNPSKLIPERDSPPRGGEGMPDFEARELRNNILEKVPLESIHLIGIMNINNQPLAAVEIPELSLIKQVKVGDWLGVDFGKITQISNQEITVKEVIEDPSGEWIERINSLQLQEKEDGK
jgi:type IV pilus assembly protein PilP